MNNLTQNRGSLIFALLLLLVFSALGAALLLSSINENNIAKRNAYSRQAFWAAEAGVQKAINDMNNNSCHGFVQQNTSTACTSCSSCGSGNKTMAVTIPNAGDFDVVVNNGNTTATCTGSSPSRTSTSKTQRNIQVTIGKVSPFSYAAFAQGQVSLANNTFIDSYDSGAGAYNVSTNSSTNGDIGSNGTTAGIVAISNNVSVGGSVSTGVNGTVTVGSGAVITGTTTHTNNVSLPDVVVPSSLTGLASGGTLSVPLNGTTTLPAGSYKYTNMNLANNSVLNITGNVSLYLTSATAVTTGNNVQINLASGASLAVYVDGVLSIPNNVTLSSPGNYPKNLQFYSTYTGANGISINNNGILATVVYAPKTNINVGNNDDLFGSLVGKTVTVNNNSAIHYDVTLKNLTTTQGTNGIASWQEI